MNPRRIIILALLLALAGIVLKTLYQAGTFKSIKPHAKGTIKKITGVVGVEDITIDPETGLAFLSSDDRWAYSLHQNPKKGAIYLLNLNDSLPKPLELTKSFKDDFHPHGISLLRLPNGHKRLFVVNHSLTRKDTTLIEIFDWQDSLLIHRESLKNPAYLPSPNDIVAVGERSFYVSNDHDTPPTTLRDLKDYLQVPTGYVSYYDGERWQKTTAKDIAYANGINVATSKLFVASTTGRRVLVYDINPTSGALSLNEEIFLDTGVDNIEFDTAGNLWIGCHPQMLKFVSHAKHPEKPSPSQTLRVRYTGKERYEVQEVFLDTGEKISGMSVAAPYRNKVLMGSVFQNFILLYTEP